MTHRFLASVSITVLGIGLMLVSEAAFARGGGFARGSGGFRLGAFPMHHAGAAFGLHRRWFRSGASSAAAAAWGEAGGSGMGYGTSVYVPPVYYLVSYNQLYDQPSYPAIAETGPAPRHISSTRAPGSLPICETQTVRVPSERGGQRTVNVTRC